MNTKQTLKIAKLIDEENQRLENLIIDRLEEKQCQKEDKIILFIMTIVIGIVTPMILIPILKCFI